jgi:DNA repair protein RecO (recombination protein O)
MEWSEAGIVLAARRHAEADTIIEVLTEGRGRHLGLVKGGRSRRLRPVLQPGNTLQLTWRARLHEHLGNFRAEPLKERSAVLMGSAVGAFGLGLAAAHLRLLPERDPHPRLYRPFADLLDCLDQPARAAEEMARFELLLLDELGFGLDLGQCAATGTADDLIYVSPRSGRAVSRNAGAPYADKLLPLPDFLRAPARAAGSGGPAELQAAFLLTGYFLERHVFDLRGEGLPAVRLHFLKAIRTAVEAAA